MSTADDSAIDINGLLFNFNKLIVCETSFVVSVDDWVLTVVNFID